MELPLQEAAAEGALNFFLQISEETPVLKSLLNKVEG